MSLSRLHESVRGRLRSGVAITCLAQAVTELVDNSIDAGATCIAVRVDFSKFKLQVVDNGRGISESDLGLMGDRYVTSKCHTLHDLDHNLQHLGYRGEAIASITELSRTVEISSRHHLSQSTYNKVFLNGKIAEIKLGSTQRPSVGTTVTLSDFFYNMPVRRKNMVEVFELEQVKKAVEFIALVNPSVSFSVRNDVTGSLILQTHKTNSVLSNFGLLFSSNKVRKMKNVNFSRSKYTVSGFISTETHHNNSLQFIYVNRRIVKKTPLHTCVNSVLNNSLLTKKPSQKGKLMASKYTKTLSSPTRILDKHSVYVLLIECPRSEYDICLEPAKTLVEFKNWDELITLLTFIVNKFLKENRLYIGLGLSAKSQHSNATTQSTNSNEEKPVFSEIGRDLGSHSYSASETQHLSLQSMATPTCTISTIHSEHSSVPTTTPTSFSLSTYHNKASPIITKPTVLQQSSSFLVSYNSPSPEHSGNKSILSRLLSKNFPSSRTLPTSLKPTVFSPLHSSTVSSKISNLVMDKMSTDSHQQFRCSSIHHPIYHSTPREEPSICPLSVTTSEQHSSRLQSSAFEREHLSPVLCTSLDPVDSKPIESSETSLLPQGEDIVHCDSEPLLSDSDSTVPTKPLWRETLDPLTGRKIYIHSVSGNCSYSSPIPTKTSPTTIDSEVNDTTAISEAMFERRPSPHSSDDCSSFMPRPKSQRLMVTTSTHHQVSMNYSPSEGSRSPNLKWRDWKEMERRGEKKTRRTNFEALLKNWKNPTFKPGQEDVLDIGYGAGTRRQIRVHNMINKYTFTKDMFNDLVVLNQIDNKFIACLMSKERNGGKKNLLVMVDQHAAHERVRLETLLDDLYEDSSTGVQCVKRSMIQPPLVMALPPSLISMAKHFKKHLDQIGVSTAVDSKGGLVVSSLPSVFVRRDTSGGNRGRPAVDLSILQDMVTGHLELLQETGGASSTTPAAITHVLNSQACHGAIKFGDPLTLTECQVLIFSLSKCKLPFQCAHGRPSLVPILDLDQLSMRYPAQQDMKTPNLASFVEQFHTT